MLHDIRVLRALTPGAFVVVSLGVVVVLRVVVVVGVWYTVLVVFTLGYHGAVP